MYQVKAVITDHKLLGSGYHLLNLLAADVAEVAQPGQFVQLRVMEGNEPLLSRPISIYHFDADSSSITLIFKVVGKGTDLLAKRNPGEIIELLGPLGNGFALPETAQRVALVAGGVGMPPLYCLAEKLIRKGSKVKFSLFYGGRTRTDLLELNAWERLKVKIFPMTDDGSYGKAGLVTEAFLAEHQRAPFDFVVTCGPQPMLKAVQQLALASNLSGQLSLEAHMACGVGACLGCVCKTISGYQRVCVEGPVFGISEVLWE